MKFSAEHFEQARRVASQWRREGYSHAVVVREGARASRCYPCRQQDVPQGTLLGWDYYLIPTLERLATSAPSGSKTTECPSKTSSSWPPTRLQNTT